MNILVVHNYYKIPGGEDVVVAGEIDMLKEHGHNVITYFRHNDEMDSMSSFRKISMVIDTIFSLKTYKDIKMLIKSHNIDIVHVHNTLPLVRCSVYYAANSMKVPVVQTMHNFRLLCPAGTFYRNGRICEDCVSKGLQCSVKHKCYRESRLQSLAVTLSMKIHRLTGIYKKINYICLTEFNKNKLLHKDVLGINPTKVFIKPNFTNGSQSELNIFSRKNQYVVVGRLEKLKGTHVILKAWRKLGDKAPKLIFCGTGDLENKAKAYVKKYNVSNVEFKGYVDNAEVKLILAESKALIFAPQWYETFGLVLAESFSVGTPVIVGDIGNPGMLVEQNKTGMHFKYNNANDLAETILSFENMLKEQYNLLQKGAHIEYSKYAREHNYEKLIKIYTACEKLG